MTLLLLMVMNGDGNGDDDDDDDDDGNRNLLASFNPSIRIVETSTMQLKTHLISIVLFSG